MSVIKWDEMLLPYEQAVSELSVKFRSLMTGYEALGLQSPIEMVAQRVKRPSSILAKAKRKDIILSEIESQIEDIAGIRLICRFVDDIVKVVDLIKARDGMDMTILQERNYLENRKPSGYRSYHIIVKYPLLCALGQKEVLAEIQIRTMAMNYWAVIEHALQYKHGGELPADLNKRLKQSAETTAHLDEEFSKIRGESNYVVKERENAFRTKLTDELIHSIRILYRTGREDEADALNGLFLKLYAEDDWEGLEKLLVETNVIMNNLLES